MNRRRLHRSISLATLAAAVLLLAGLGERIALRSPDLGTAEAYHARIRALGEQLPEAIGPWQGEPAEVPRTAIELIKPNVLWARRFTHAHTGRDFTAVLVQCADARDLAGHYPRICYVNSGWHLKSAEDRTWHVEGQALEGVEYLFLSRRDNRFEQIVVLSFLFLPDAGTFRTIDQVYTAAEDRRRRPFGGGQVQVITEASLSAQERDEMLRLVARSLLPIVNHQASGESH
ncbi:MAG: exosortase-associated EpsI family protein [Planctomycetes bacterium]|jgi:hypothetical protein|nr:exosortase-associated EpsI family protein [Planctomycetota bacterium]